MSSSNNSPESTYNPINQLLKKSLRKSFLKEKKIPKNIGPYELKEKITNGSYCKIYLAKSKYTGDKVAIKVINKIYLLEIMEDLLLIKRQLEILKVIKHRNILTLYEIYESPNFIFIVMEYIPGKNLCEMIVTKKRFSEEEAKKIFVQIFDALNYLHKMNICHRNITSNHILFDINNIPKLISFTYSTFYDKKQQLKDSFGSLCHSCPEIISESPYNPELSDTWSLGTVLYTMVAGYLPFSEENDEKNKDLIVCGKVEYPKEMSNKLKDLLKHMMEPNPKKRYDLNKIMKHPWFKPFNDKLIGGCNYLKMSFPVDDRILNAIEKFGFNKDKIKLDLKNNKYNMGTGLYKLLVKKANISGFHSVSDLGSKEYLDYQENKNNYFIDGDDKYAQYLKEIQKKMQRIEKIIFGFQEKEENIIKELNKLEENIRNKNNGIMDNVVEKTKGINDESIKTDKRKSSQRKSPEQKSNIINDINKNINININKKLNKIKSCSIFPKVINSLTRLNLSLNYKNNNMHNKPRKTNFSNNVESWQDTSIFIKKRKSYLNNSTFFESLLKKSHPDNIRKSEIRKNIISDINQVIIEEKNENNNNNNEKKKSLRYSLSFDDDDNDISSEESNDNISKIDPRQLSMFDEDGLKLLKELKLLKSSMMHEDKKQRESKLNKENCLNQKNKNKNKTKRVSAISKFVNFEEDNEINKKGEYTNEKKEDNYIENIYSTIKSDNNENNEIKKDKINKQIMEINKINDIIISSKPKEIIVNDIEICSYYNDKKELSKLNMNNTLTKDFCSIDFIHNKFKEKNLFTYFNDIKVIKKVEIISNDIIFPIKPVDIKKEKENKEEFRIEQNTLNLNSSHNSNEELVTKINEIKKYTLKTENNEQNSINKIKSASSTLNMINKYPKSMKSQKNKIIKDKIKLLKKSKLKTKKYQSNKCHSKYNEDLSFINISEISEIKSPSIMSPCYLNTNNENKENLTTNNNNFIDNKSFQSKSPINNLSMTHENNIFLGNASTLNTYRFNNCYDYDLNNFYMVHLDNFNKNTYSQNYILNIKKKNLAERLKEEIQKSIDTKQIRSSLLMSNGSNLIDIKKSKSKSKKNKSNKHIVFNNNNICDNNEINFNSSKCMKINNNSNGNSIIKDKNTSKTLKSNIPDYVNFLKIRQKQIINSIGYRNKIKSNGKSIETVNNENKSIKKNKSKSKKKEENCDENFIFCNNYYCFNTKHRRDYENRSTNKKKENKSLSKKHCDCDKNKINNKDNNIKSNGKKLEISKEKLKFPNNYPFRSYVNIYEKDKKYKLNKEKIKNGISKKDDKITYLYKNNKKCDYTYKRVFFKFNS